MQAYKLSKTPNGHRWDNLTSMLWTRYPEGAGVKTAPRITSIFLNLFSFQVNQIKMNGSLACAASPKCSRNLLSLSLNKNTKNKFDTLVLNLVFNWTEHQH